MIISISKDKTVLLGMENESIDLSTLVCVLIDKTLFLKDKKNKIKFQISDEAKSCIINKRFLMLCSDNPFDFHRITVTIKE